MAVLLVEDNPDDARAIHQLVTEGQPAHWRLHTASSLSTAIELLGKTQVDAILLDLWLPDSEGLETLAEARTHAPRVPVIVLTGVDDEATAVKALHQGAQDYLVKGVQSASGLSRALRYAIERQRILLELEAYRENQLAMKDRCLSHVSHEFRAPMTAIYGFATLLLDGLAGDLAAEQREYLEIIVRNVRHLRSMVDDVLVLTRADAATRRTPLTAHRTSVRALIGEAIDNVRVGAAHKSITLREDSPATPPDVYADNPRILQVLMNLLDNAVKFTPPGGEITVRAFEAPEEPGFVRVVVADNGPGVAADLLHRVFERLYQIEDTQESSRSGMGLGLFIARQLIESHGGRIWLESEPGKGACFLFTLPICSMHDVLLPLVSGAALRKGTLALIAIALRPARLDASPVAAEEILRAVDSVLKGAPGDGYPPAQDALCQLRGMGVHRRLCR
jgi:signal transduction histidine kinase